MSRWNAACLGVIVLTPLASAVAASAFSLVRRDLAFAFVVPPVAGLVNFVAALLMRVPARHESALHAGAVGYGVVATFIYAVTTVLIADQM